MLKPLVHLRTGMVLLCLSSYIPACGDTSPSVLSSSSAHGSAVGAAFRLNFGLVVVCLISCARSIDQSAFVVSDWTCPHLELDSRRADSRSIFICEQKLGLLSSTSKMTHFQNEAKRGQLQNQTQTNPKPRHHNRNPQPTTVTNHPLFDHSSTPALARLFSGVQAGCR